MTPFELYHLKAGSIPAADLDNVERIRAGQYLEPAIAAWAADKFKMDLKPVEEYRIHPFVAGMGASWDFEEDATDNNCPPVEIKNVDGLVFRDKWEASGDLIVEAPLHILIQLQHQLACRPEVDHGWLIACVGGNELKRMAVPRHEPTINKVEVAVKSFWDSVKSQTPPDPNLIADADVISKLHSSAGGETIDMSGDPTMTDIALDYLALKGEVKDIEGQLKAMKSKMLMEIGEAKKVLGSGYSIDAGITKGSSYTVNREPFRRFTIRKRKDS